MFATLMRDIDDMPARMRAAHSRAVLFLAGVVRDVDATRTAAVTQVHFGATDTTSAAYNEGANWVGVLFAAYNGFAALAAIVIPIMVRTLRSAREPPHQSVARRRRAALVPASSAIRTGCSLSMVGVGFAWASILSLPYALLAGSVPSRKMGVYMGIFNFFIVIPQLVAASVLGCC